MNYKTKRELIERKEEAVAKLLEFLREEDDYQSIMTQMAMAQTTIMELMDTAMAHGHDRKMVEITVFLSTIQCLMLELRDLSDYAKIEKSDE